MTAEVYHADPNLDAAARRLAMLGSSPPAQIAGQALQFGLQAGYPVNDLQMIQDLTSALQTWQPGGFLPPVRDPARMKRAGQPGSGSGQ
jgi:hypothetical protein